MDPIYFNLTPSYLGNWFETIYNYVVKLEDLKQEWYEKNTPPINGDCIQTAITLLTLLYKYSVTEDINIKPPYITPREDGGVMIENLTFINPENLSPTEVEIVITTKPRV